eukprot:15848-Heterococcus_DN1.PRE.2
MRLPARMACCGSFYATQPQQESNGYLDSAGCRHHGSSQSVFHVHCTHDLSVSCQPSNKACRIRPKRHLTVEILYLRVQGAVKCGLWYMQVQQKKLESAYMCMEHVLD